LFFFFKQKTAYEIKRCDWSSDVCSSDLEPPLVEVEPGHMMSCHIPIDELRRLQAEARRTDATLTTPPEAIQEAEALAAGDRQ